MSSANADSVEQRISELKKTIPKLHWGRLRFLGRLRTLVLSYVVGIVVAMPDLIGTDLTKYLKQAQILWPMVTFVVGVGLAYLCYELFCPVIIKRFENLPDFYEHQLNIKKLQLETYPDDPFNANLMHVAEHYIGSLSERRLARYITLVLYIAGFLSLLFLILEFYLAL